MARDPEAPSDRRILRASFCAALLLAFAVATILLVATPPVAAAPAAQVPAPGESLCFAVPKSASRPADVLLGESVDVTLTVNAFCGSEPPRHHIVLVLDGSNGMRGPGASTAFERHQKEAASEFVRNVIVDAPPYTKVGIVVYGGKARILCELTDQADLVIDCIDRVTKRGEPEIDQAISRAHEVLRRGRTGFPDPTRIRDTIIVTASLPNADGCPPLSVAAEAAEADGVHIFAICIRDRCDTVCLRNTVTLPERHYYEAPAATDLISVFKKIRADLEPIRRAQSPPPADRLVVVLPIGRAMRYVPDSAVPPPSDTGADLEALTWDMRAVPRTGITLTLSLEPLKTGYLPTVGGASGVITDYLGRDRVFDFDDRNVFVLAPNPLNTPTPDPRTIPLFFPSTLKTLGD